MRILQVAQSYPPYLDGGGPPVKVQAISEGLVRLGHQVTVLTVDHGNPSRTWVCERGGVEVLFLKYIVRHRAVSLTVDVIPFCSRRLSDFDVVHIYGLYDLVGPMVAYFARCSYVPYVVEPLGMYRPIVQNQMAKRLYHVLLGRTLIRNAAHIVATSPQERDQLIADGLPETQVVLRQNGLNLDDYGRPPTCGGFRRRWGIPEEAQMVFFLGRVVPIKSIDLLVKAVHQLDGLTPWLVVSGPDEQDGYRGYLEQLVRKLGLSDRVIFTGPLYGADKVEALADADVLILPSWNESFGNVAAEAVATGTPVIVTEGCGIAPWVEDRVGLVVSHDEDGIRKGLQRLLTDIPLRERFRARCSEVAEEFSWDEPLDRMERMYEQLVHDNHRGF